MSREWRPGFVRMVQGDVRLEKGQNWGYFHPDLPSANTEHKLALTVIETSSEGQVILRPLDLAAAERMFPPHETDFKGKLVMTRKCPFLWVEPSRTPPEGTPTTKVVAFPDGRQPGDLLVHEAWDIWLRMCPDL